MTEGRMGRAGDSPPEDPREERLAERGRALVAAAVTQTGAPPALRTRIEAQRRAAAPVRRRRGIALFGGLAGAAAAVAAAIVVGLGGGAEPGVRATAQLAVAGPTLPAPRPDPANRALLKKSVDGVPFPDWSKAFAWRAAGALRDTIEGRTADTVFYRSAIGAMAAYTIVGGDTIAPIDHARRRRMHGTDLWVSRRGGRTIVTWERNGHTCVLSAGAGVPERNLLALAAWDAGGDVPF
jgi:hypothetical protein